MIYYTLGNEIYESETHSKVADAANEDIASNIVSVLNNPAQQKRAVELTDTLNAKLLALLDRKKAD